VQSTGVLFTLSHFKQQRRKPVQPSPLRADEFVDQQEQEEAERRETAEILRERREREERLRQGRFRLLFSVTCLPPVSTCFIPAPGPHPTNTTPNNNIIRTRDTAYRTLVGRASEAAGESVLARLGERSGKREQAMREAEEAREEVRREEEAETQALVGVKG
jgi:hypothetical protein